MLPDETRSPHSLEVGSFTEIKAWRDKERERLPSIVHQHEYKATENIIDILTAILQDD